MGRWLTALVVATVALGASSASAQETTGASRLGDYRISGRRDSVDGGQHRFQGRRFHRLRARRLVDLQLQWLLGR